MIKNNKTPVFLFATYFLLVLSIFFSRPFELKTDIMDIISPSSENGKIKEDALKNISKEYTTKINILFQNKDFNRAIEAGFYFQEQLKNENISIQFEMKQDKAVIIDLMSKYNYHLLSDSMIADLEQNNYKKIKNKALSFMYSTVNMNLLPIDKDPFFFAPDFMMNLGITKSGFFPKNDILSAEYEDQAFAYMIISINKDKAFMPSYLLPIMKKIEQVKEDTHLKFEDVKINISGVPVHSYHATSNSFSEMNIISLVSILFILAISYTLFKSPNCFIYALFTIVISFLMTFFLTTIIFGHIHVLVLVFGASLIGICIDYHIHYFAERPYSKDSINTLEHIKKPIRISFITSLTGFAVMMFSGIGIITHMAVFAMIGLINAYVIIRYLYPIILKNTKILEIPKKIIELEKTFTNMVAKVFHKHLYLKVLTILIISSFGISMIETSDSIKDLYKPNQKLLEAEILFAKVSHMGSAPVMYIAQGETVEEALKEEEKVRIFLDEMIVDEKISGYKAISQIVPSKEKQNKTFFLVSSFFNQELEKYAKDLDFSPILVNKIETNLQNQKNDFITIDDISKYSIFSALKGLFIEDESFATIILIENAKDKNSLIDYADKNQKIIYSDKIGELSDILKHLRVRAEISLLATIIIVTGFLTLYYRKVKKSIGVVMPSVLSIAIILGGFGYLGVGVSLFHILALFLIVCFGIDYSIFRVETKDKFKHSGIAVFISCITTLASFGALAFTSFAVTKALGTTLSIGIFLSYLLSPIATIYSASVPK